MPKPINVHDNPPANAIDIDADETDAAQAADASDPDAVPAKLIDPGEPLT